MKYGFGITLGLIAVFFGASHAAFAIDPIPTYSLEVKKGGIDIQFMRYEVFYSQYDPGTYRNGRYEIHGEGYIYPDSNVSRCFRDQSLQLSQALNDSKLREDLRLLGIKNININSYTTGMQDPRHPFSPDAAGSSLAQGLGSERYDILLRANDDLPCVAKTSAEIAAELKSAADKIRAERAQAIADKLAAESDAKAITGPLTESLTAFSSPKNNDSSASVSQAERKPARTVAAHEDRVLGGDATQAR